ncbi:hypothetical protein ACC713_38525, partial [Rhizobium johnstonii]
ERALLRPLTNKPPITLFMATLGLSYVIEGAAQLIWVTQVHGLDLGIEDVPFDVNSDEDHDREGDRECEREGNSAF